MAATYDTIGRGYARGRRTDPRIAAAIAAALGDARTVVNVGAGTGSYEPADRRVVAVEPSAVMIAQRPPAAAPVVRARAEALPFADRAADAVMAVLTIHHWTDWRRGAAECARVAGDRVVVLTWDPSRDDFWLIRDYFPELLAIDRALFPPVAALAAALGDRGVEVRAVPVPHDCADGFLGAYWRRPEMYLDPTVRGAMSSFALLPHVDARIDRLRADLASGAWDARHGALRERAELDIGYRLVVAGAT